MGLYIFFNLFSTTKYFMDYTAPVGKELVHTCKSYRYVISTEGRNLIQWL